MPSPANSNVPARIPWGNSPARLWDLGEASPRARIERLNSVEEPADPSRSTGSAPQFGYACPKRAVQAGADLPLDTSLTVRHDLQTNGFASNATRLGIALYVEQRKSHLRGR